MCCAQKPRVLFVSFDLTSPGQMSTFNIASKHSCHNELWIGRFQIRVGQRYRQRSIQPLVRHVRIDDDIVIANCLFSNDSQFTKSTNFLRLHAQYFQHTLLLWNGEGEASFFEDTCLVAGDVLGYLADKSLERKLADEKFASLLVSANLPKSDRSWEYVSLFCLKIKSRTQTWSVPMRLLHPAGIWVVLPGGL